MPNNPQLNTSKLNTYYEHALDNSGTDEFYAFLYKYVEVIKKDKQLFKTVNDFFIKRLAEDYRAIDNETLKRVLLPYLAKRGLSIKKIDSLTDYQRFEIMWTTSAENNLWPTKPYVCWFILQSFYGKISDDKEAQSLVPKDSVLARTDYATALKVFHADFTNWLAENTVSEDVAVPQKVATDTNSNASVNVSLRLKSKVLRLYIENSPSEVVKRFKSKKANNIRAYFELQNNKGSYLTKDDMHFKGSSAVKDIPKTMGISGVLADHFIDVDSKGQRLRVPKTIIVSRSDLEIILAYVKRINSSK